MDYISRKQNINHHMRAVLIDWLIEVAEEYKLGSITFHTAVGLVDRCLGSCVIAKDASVERIKGEMRGDLRELIVDRKTLQLLGW